LKKEYEEGIASFMTFLKGHARKKNIAMHIAWIRSSIVCLGRTGYRVVRRSLVWSSKT
jgi:hypothetical protein